MTRWWRQRSAKISSCLFGWGEREMQVCGRFYPNGLPLQWVQLFLALLSPLGIKPPNPLRVGASFDPRENKLNNCWQCWKHNAHHWWLITTADGGDSALWERRRVYTGTKKQQVHCRACFWLYDGTYLRYSESQRAGWASRDQRWCIIPCGAPVKRRESWLCFNWVAHVPPMCR